MSVNEVRKFFGGEESPVSAGTIYRWVREGRLAAPVRLGKRTSRWRRKDCEKALKEMAEREV